jgi:excisionase family DNA binding protein
MPAKPRKRLYIPTGNPRGRPRKQRQIAPASEPLAKPAPVPPVPQPLAYRIEDAAQAVGVSTSYMKRKVASGEVPSVKWGRIRLIPADGLRALLERGS